MESMTGFGSGNISGPQMEGKIEIKSTNHKYLDVQIRGPRELFALEERMRQKITQTIHRGRVEIRLSVKFNEEYYANASLNTALAKSYHRGLQELKEMTGETEALLPLLANLPEVFTLECQELDTEILWETIEESLGEALDELLAMKKVEGEKLHLDINRHKKELATCLEQIDQLKDRVVVRAEERLRERLQELLEDQAIDEDRVIQEIAILADKSNIEEEIVRLQSHISQLENISNASQAVGRKLDFLLQEMNREVNTIASKASDDDISRLVIEAKSAIEKIREQVQNVE